MPPLNKAKLLIIDDDRDLLDVLCEWLSHFGAEVHTATSGAEALDQAKRHTFDIAITDLQMPGLSGQQVLSLLKERDPAMQVIILTGHGTMDDAIAALREGRAFDFLLKPLRDFEKLNQVLEKALDRRNTPNGARQTGPLPEHIEALSPREREILVLLAEGLDNKAIADRLFLSEKTVKNHLTRIYEKLKVETRTQAIVTSQKYGLI